MLSGVINQRCCKSSIEEPLSKHGYAMLLAKYSGYALSIKKALLYLNRAFFVKQIAIL